MWGRIRKAAETFIKQLLPNDRIMVVSFNEKVQFVCDFTSDHAELKRAVTVLKTRGSAHQQHLRQYTITPDGVTLGDQFAASQSLL